jgi:hypothetical protein
MLILCSFNYLYHIDIICNHTIYIYISMALSWRWNIQCTYHLEGRCGQWGRCVSHLHLYSILTVCICKYINLYIWYTIYIYIYVDLCNPTCPPAPEWNIPLLQRRSWGGTHLWLSVRLRMVDSPMKTGNIW